jgi:hypothetical protein
MIRTAAAATLTLAALAFAPTPAAQALPSAPCAASEITAAEYAHLQVGQTLAQVTAIIGGPGTLVSTAGSTSVYSWSYCADSGVRLVQRLSFVTPPPRFGGQPVLWSIPLPGR